MNALLASLSRGLRRLLSLLLPVAALAMTSTAFADEPAEFYECSSWLSVPRSVLFKREAQGWLPIDVVRRTETYYDGSVRVLYKNPEMVATHGPLHGRNCTVNATQYGTQWISFRLKTVNFFGTAASPYSGVANHLAVLLRGRLNRQLYQAGGTQAGRGLAIFNAALGVHMENFAPGSPGVVPANIYLEDDKWYSITMHANPWGMAVWVTDEATQTQLSGYYSAGIDTYDFGYGFGVLCNDDTSCEYVNRFEVLIQDIQTNWF